VALDLLDNVFLLHFALEAAQCILEGFTLLQSDLCQRNYTPKLAQLDSIVIARFCTQVKGYVQVLAVDVGKAAQASDQKIIFNASCTCLGAYALVAWRGFLGIW
jgi:hypothetical protein